MRDALKERYTNVEAALSRPVTTGTQTAHQLDPEADGVKTLCNSRSPKNHKQLTPEIAVEHYTLCRKCYGPVLAALAHDTESPVRVRDAPDTSPVDARDDLEVAADGSGQDWSFTLAAPTEQVLVGSSGTSMHAPTAEGEAVCNCTPDKPRLVDPEKHEPFKDYCKACFDI